jgi:hypothetical protein
MISLSKQREKERERERDNEERERENEERERENEGREREREECGVAELIGGHTHKGFFSLSILPLFFLQSQSQFN